VKFLVKMLILSKKVIEMQKEAILEFIQSQRKSEIFKCNMLYKLKEPIKLTIGTIGQIITEEIRE